MADQVLHGSRMGVVSYETDRDYDLVSRMMIRCHTESGEILKVPFVDNAEIPGERLCKNGQIGELVEGEDTEVRSVKPPRIHWDTLRECRFTEELDVLLDERVDSLRKRRRNAARLLKVQREVEKAEKNA